MGLSESQSNNLVQSQAQINKLQSHLNFTHKICTIDGYKCLLLGDYDES